MTTCDTDLCDNTATHTDQFSDPICQECVDGAIKNGEPPFDFIALDAKSDITATQAAENLKLITGTGTHAEPVASCTYNYNKNCSCPESLRPGICPTQPECGYEFRARANITIFEESLTARGLEKIATKALDMPAIAKTKEAYDAVYEFSTALKRASVAARKKIKELKLNLKKQYNEAKGKIEKDQTYVLAIIDPIIGKLMKSRDYLESWTEAIKINNALKVAALAETERVRINKEKKKQQDARAAELLTAAEQVEKDRLQLELDNAQLELDKRIFEREKHGLTVDEAWDHAAFHFAEWISQADLDEMLDIEDVSEEVTEIDLKLASDELAGPGPTDSDINELAEFAKDEPAEPVKTHSFADLLDMPPKTDNFHAAEVDFLNNAFQQERETDELDTKPDVIYSTDPAEKEKQLLEQDEFKILQVKMVVQECRVPLESMQRDGFESQTATTATRRLIESIQAAADVFEHEVGLSKLAPELTPPVIGTQLCHSCNAPWPNDVEACPGCGIVIPF